MKTALIVLAALVPALAFAEDPKPFVLRNGRAMPAGEAPAAPPAAAPSGSPAGSLAGQIINAATQASAFGTSAVHPTLSGGAAAQPAAASPDDTGNAVKAFRHTSGRRGITRTAGKSRKAADTIPPNYAKPGALIRSEGQLPQYSDPGNARTHSVEGGNDIIAADPRHVTDTGHPAGVTWGKPDTPPGANPSGSGAGGNGVTANGPDITVDNSHSNNVNGNQNGGSGSNGNGNGNNGGSSFDPSF